MHNGICLENLPSEVDVAKMCSNFKKFGRILSARIHVDEHLKSLGKGYISFDNPSSAQSAAKSMNGCKAYGNIIKVVIGENNFCSETVNKLYTKIFVKNVNLQWDECDLSHEFSKFGDVSEVSISKTDGVSNGYGFIEFKDHSCAKAAVEDKQKHLIVRPYVPKELRSIKSGSVNSAKELLEKSVQLNNLHVKNIPKDMDDAELKKLFERFGHIISAKVDRDNAGKSKGFGFVCFESKEDAATAKANMDGYSCSTKLLEVNFFQKKEARQCYLAVAKAISENTLVPENKKPVKKENSYASKNRNSSTGGTRQRVHVSTQELCKTNLHRSQARSQKFF